MIYFAQRASTLYSEKLSHISRSKVPLNIISVIGGLSFLHALSPQTKSLTLLDPDPDTHLYCKMILELLVNSESAKEFWELLTSQHVSDKWWQSDCFGEPKAVERRAQECIGDPVLAELYSRTYGRMQFDSSSATGQIGESKILFFGSNLAPLTFCWGIGSGAFASNDSYDQLKSALRALKPKYIQARFEDLNYPALLQEMEGEIALLVSNTESPLFSKQDAVFRAIARSITKPVQYISWHRALRLEPETGSVQVGEKALASILVQDRCCLLRAHLNSAVPAGSIIYENVGDLKEKLHYGWGTFFMDCTKFNQIQVAEEVRDILKLIVPCFSRIVFWGLGEIAEIFKAMDKSSFQHSYRLVTLEWRAECFLMKWDLIGLADSERGVKLE